jgi:hypothetical protein
MAFKHSFWQFVKKHHVWLKTEEVNESNGEFKSQSDL